MHLAVHHTGQGRSSRVHQPELPRVPTHGGGPVSGTGGATVAGTVASSWHLTAPSWHLTANTVSATDRGGRGSSVRGPPGWHPTATGSAAAHSVTSMGAGIRTGRATDPSTVSDVWAAAAARTSEFLWLQWAGTTATPQGAESSLLLDNALGGSYNHHQHGSRPQAGTSLPAQAGTLLPQAGTLLPPRAGT